MSVLAEIVSEQWEFRELLVRMTARDLLLRYKQTVMGFGWAVFMPLVNTAIFSVIFTRVAVIDVGGPYPVYAFCGIGNPRKFFATLQEAGAVLAGRMPFADHYPYDDGDMQYQVEVVKKAIQQLPEGYRLVLTLYLLEGYDHEVLDRTAGPVAYDYEIEAARLR